MSVDSEKEAITIGLIVGPLCVLLVIISVSLRIYIRTRVTRTFALDDVLLIISACCFLIMMSMGMGESFNGGGNVSGLTREEEDRDFLFWLIEEIFYLASCAFLKLSISVFLLRLAISRVHRWVIYITAAVYTISSFGFMLGLIFNCTPVDYFWDKTIKGGHCHSKADYFQAYLWNWIFTVITDFIYALLPVWIVWHTLMDRKSKISVAIILSMGLISTIVTIIRFKYIKPITSDHGLTTDIIYFGLCSIIEPGLGIIAASLSTMRSLLRLIYRKFGWKWGGPPEQPKVALGFWSFSGQKSKNSGNNEAVIERPNNPGNINVWLEDLERAEPPPEPPSKCQTVTRISAQTVPEDMEMEETDSRWRASRTDRWSAIEGVNPIPEPAPSSPKSSASSVRFVIQGRASSFESMRAESCSRL